MANKVKKLFLLGSLLTSAFMTIVACDSTQPSASSSEQTTQASSESSLQPSETSSSSSIAPSSSDSSSSSTEPIPEPVVLTGITASSTKENYEYGEDLALLVNANYSDGTSVPVTEYQIEGFDSQAPGVQTVTVKFDGAEATLQVVVNERVNLFPATQLQSFLTQQAITVEIPSPVGYDEWTNKTDVEEDGTHYFVVTTKDEGVPGENALEDQYAALLKTAEWTVEQEDGVYNAFKEEGDARLSFYTKDGTFNLRVNQYILYPEKSYFGSLVKQGAYLEEGGKIVFGSKENGIIFSSLNEGKFESIDCEYTGDEIRNLASNVVRFTLEKSGSRWIMKDVRGRKLGATGVGQLAWDEGSTEWMIVMQGGSQTIIMNNEKSYGRLAFDPEIGTLTTVPSVVGSKLVYPQIFALVETPLIYPTDISLDGNTEIGLGRSMSLSVKTIPANANQLNEVTWESSNEEVATVNEKGVITALSLGETTITATTKSKGVKLTASYNLTIVEFTGAQWTIMLYVCGSNLESQSGLATADIREILSVNGQPEDVNIIIETGGSSRWSHPKISANKLCRFHVENKDIILDESLTKVNMGKESTLESYLNWGIENYPADKYGVIFWNHGGALDGVCFDDYSGSDSLLASEVSNVMGRVFEANGITDKFEFVGYDACLMQVQDIAEINSEYFNYMVTSEEVENGEGWAYTSWVDDLYALRDTETVLKACADGFVSSFGSYGNDQTLSVLKLANMENYFNKFEALAASIKEKAKSNLSTFKTLLKSAKCFYDVSGYGNIDAYDFLNKLKAKSDYASYADQIEEVKAAFNELVIHSAKGNAAGNAYGLCLHAEVGYYGSYPASETHFNTWRSIFN